MRSDEKILFFHKIEEEIDNFSDNAESSDISIKSVFGLWKDRNVTKETLQRKAWMKIERCSN